MRPRDFRITDIIPQKQSKTIKKNSGSILQLKSHGWVSHVGSIQGVEQDVGHHQWQPRWIDRIGPWEAHKNGWRNHSNWQLDEVNKIESTSTSLDIHVFFWKARGSSISGSALRGQQSRKHF